MRDKSSVRQSQSRLTSRRTKQPSLKLFRPWQPCSFWPVTNWLRHGLSKMATLERGFKYWAERTAARIRRELGLSDDAPLDLGALAELIEVRLMVPSDVAAMPKDVL